MAGLGRLTLDLVARTAAFTEPMRQAGDAAVRESQRIEASLSSAIGMVKNLGAAAIAGITVNSMIETADAYTQMAAQIRNATADQQEYDKVQKHLLETANTTYRSLQEAQQVYLDVGGALKAYGATTEQALRITDSLSFSFTHNATAADKAKSATDAFMKSVYSGKVSGDSFRSMLSAIPTVIDDLSASLDLSKDKILTMGNAGEFTADQLKIAFDQSREKSEELANAMENSLADGMMSVKNAWSTMLGEINLTYGITNKMAAGLGIVAENMKGLAVGATAAATVFALKLTPAAIAASGSFVTGTVESVRYQIALARMATQATGTSTSLLMLGAAAKGALAFMTGPVGLVLTAGAVAAGYIAMKNSTEEANKKLEEQAAIANKTAKELRELEGVQKRSTVDDLTEAFDAQNKALRKSELAVGSRIIAIQNAMKQDREAVDVSNKVRAGVLSYTDAIDQLNKMPISTELYKALVREVEQYGTNRDAALKTAEALKTLGKEVQLAGHEANNAASKIANNSNELDRNAAAAKNAAAAQAAYSNSISNTIFSNAFAYNLKKLKMYSDTEIKYLTQIGEAKRKAGAEVIITKEDEEMAKRAAYYEDQKAKAFEKQKDAKTKTPKDNSKQLQRNAEKLIDAQKELRKNLEYEFHTSEQKIAADYRKKVNEITSAGFSDSARKWYEDEAKERFRAQKNYYDAQIAFEAKAHKLSEFEKINFEHNLRILEINSRTDLENDVKLSFFNAEKEKHKKIVAWHKLEEEMLINDAQSRYLTDIQLITSKYEFERQQIALTHANDPMLRDMLITASYKTEDLDNDAAKRDAWMNYQGATGVDTSADEERSRREEAIQAALEWQLITQEEYQQKLLTSERDYHLAKAQLGLGSAQETLGTWAGLFGDMMGEQSTAYKTMFALEKGFAVAKAMMAIPESYSKAYNSVVGIPYVGPYMAPVMGAAAAAAQVAQAASIKKTNLTGMAHDGIANVPREGTWLLDKGERVLNPKDNESFTNFISNGGGQTEPVINIYNLPGQTADVSRNERGEMVILIKETIDQHVPAQYSDPNSKLSRSVTNNFDAPRKR